MYNMNYITLNVKKQNKNKLKSVAVFAFFIIIKNVTFCKFQFILHVHLYLKNLTSYYTYSNICMTFNRIVLKNLHLFGVVKYQVKNQE